MSTSKTYQQSLADAGSETRPPMLERGSYIPWASRFRRYINRKRENRKWLNKALDEGPYKFEMFIPNNLTVPKLQTAEDLQGDALLHYDAEMELMNLILLSIPNDIYNSVDACTSAQRTWKRVERLMRGTIQNKVDIETHFTNEFDQSVAEPGEALVSVYNRFAHLMNDLERNDMHFPIVTINTKFLNSLQPEWLKYVTQVRLTKRLTVDTFDDLFDYLQQFEKLVNVSRAKKLEKSHDTLALVAHTSVVDYVTHPMSVVDYEDEYQQDDVHTNSEDPLAYAMLLLPQAITQKFSTPTNNRNTLTIQCYNCNGKGHYARNCPEPRVRDSKYFMEQMLLAKKDEAGVILTNEQNDFLFDDASRMEEIEELSANICLMARIQPVDNTSDVEPSYDSAFINVKDYKRQNEELQKTHSILKRQMSENEDRYHDTVLDLEAKLKKNVDLILKLGNSLQGMFMLGPKPLSVYDQQLKHGLGYLNPYTLKQAISQCPKLYLASSLGNSEISLNVRDTEDTLDDASKSQQKVYEKMNDPIAVANKQNCWSIDYAQINALYKDFVPQKELSAEQKYFPSSFIPSDKNSNATPSIPASMPKRDNVKLEYQKLFNSIKKTRSQTQTEMDELIAHVSEKTYAYGAIRAENQNLLFTISELKTRLANVEKGKSVNTKFDKTNGSQPLLCVTPLHKHVIQKKTDVQKSEENHVVSKPVTLQTSPAKQRGVNSNKNVIAPGMYKVVTTHESQTNEAKHDLSSTGMNVASSVRRPMNRDSHVKNSVLANSKKPAKKVAVYVRKNKQTDITSENVISNKENVVHIVLWIVDSGCSKHMTAISGYGDYIQGNITICHVYYVEGLGHNLFSVGQFCDGDLEVAFRSKTCYVRNLEGDDLLTGGRE
ncbi:integrase, catalytic region, zinc finger, CCHC-type containing protein [Tanacetum coccineum]